MPDEEEKQKPSPSQNPTMPEKEGFSITEPRINPPESPFESPDPFTKNHKNFPLEESGDDE